jgi:branched-chain amino acid transport system substrate-binding protein
MRIRNEKVARRAARVDEPCTAKSTCVGMIATALLILGSSNAPAMAEDVLRFGAAVSLTEPLSTEAKQMKDGYDFYVKQINDRGGISVGGKKYKVEIVYYDDASNPETAAKLTEKLLTEDKVNFLLVPLW